MDLNILRSNGEIKRRLRCKLRSCFLKMAISVQESERSNNSMVTKAAKIWLLLFLTFCRLDIASAFEKVWSEKKSLTAEYWLEKEFGERLKWEEIFANFPRLEGYWVLWKSLIFDEDLLKRKWENPDRRKVLPRNRVDELLQ